MAFDVPHPFLPSPVVTQALLGATAMVGGAFNNELLFCAIPHKMRERILEKIGVSARAYDTTPMLYFPVTPEILTMLNNRGAYGTESHAFGKLGHDYYFEIIEDRVYCKYQQIIGSWLVAKLSEKELNMLVTHFAQVISSLPQREIA